MLINEAIERADALLENEYTKEEKYHWCDVVGAELMTSCAKIFDRAELKRWYDGAFLLPEDCGFEMIEKFIIGRNGVEIKKQDMRTYGLRFVVRGYNKRFVWFDGAPDRLTVIYRRSYRPIRRMCVKDVSTEKKENTILLPAKECPFDIGDRICVTIEGTQYELSVLDKQAVLSEKNGNIDSFGYALTYSDEDGFNIEDETYTADISRIVTDKTICRPPFDEMYIDYICAQIAFYQRKSEIYQLFIARYNARFSELCRFMKEYETENDYTEFRNWWVL